MRLGELSSEVLAALNAERFEHPHPEVRRKMRRVWLRSQGFDQATCATIADVSVRTISAAVSGKLVEPTASASLDGADRTFVAASPVARRVVSSTTGGGRRPHSSADAGADVFTLVGNPLATDRRDRRASEIDDRRTRPTTGGAPRTAVGTQAGRGSRR